MFNLKMSGIVAAIAFILSFLIGLFSNVSGALILVRSLILAVGFFVLSSVVYILMKNFIPELLDGEVSAEDAEERPGSRINITEGPSLNFSQVGNQENSQELFHGGGNAGGLHKPVFLGAQADDSEEDLGNITDLMIKFSHSGASSEGSNTGMDQNGQDGYTTVRDFEKFSEPALGESFGFDASPGSVPGKSAAEGVQSAKGTNSTEALPDLDSMSGAFLPSAGDGESDAGEYSGHPSSHKHAGGKNAPEWTGDFNAKEIAAGLRTILRRDKEG